jgi:serine/threonine protein kinase/WD40 repeat protein
MNDPTKNGFPPQDDLPRPAGPAQQLWRQWRQGRRPDLGSFLAQAGALAPLQLLAVLRVDQRERWQSGETVRVEDYLQAFPALQADAGHLLELAYGEFLLRESVGETPTLADYVARFPRCADEMKIQIELHQALEDSAERGPLGAMTPRPDSTETLALDDGAVSPDVAGWPHLAGYEIVGELGRGGMGVVYQARHVALKRLVALKMILAGPYGDPVKRSRFRAEAEAVARLQHPNIVQIHEIGEQDGRPFLSLELVGGGSLDRTIAGTPQLPRQAAQLTETLARAVHYAHEHGIIHRDLKPANILLCPMPHVQGRGFSTWDMGHWTPKITDFGLAKQLEGGAGETRTGEIIGTPSYMAPEQATGRSHEIGPAADVYALGAILYELLTGRPPLKGETPLDTLQQVLSVEPVPPSRLQPKVPHDLETICLKCLHKEPQRRYASALALAEDLQRFQCDRPIQARRTGPLERTWRWCRRNPAVAALLTSVGLLLFVLAAGATVSALWLRSRLQRAEDAERDATEKLGGSYLAQARAGRLSRRVGQRFDSLQALAEATRIARDLHMPPQKFLDLRNEAIACLALPDLRPAGEWDGWPARSWSMDFDGELKRYARVDRQGSVSIRQVAGDEEIASFPSTIPAEARPLLSRDGRFVAVYCEGLGLKLWDLERAEQAPLVEETAPVSGYDFSPDSRLFAYGVANRPINLLELPSGRWLRELDSGPSTGWLAFHPRLRQLALVGDRTVIRICDLDSGKLVAYWLQTEGVDGIAWHPDGTTLAAVDYYRKIHFWDVATKTEGWVLEGHTNAGIRLAFNHAGDVLASYDWSGTLRLWAPRTGRQIFQTQFGMACLRFSPDDRRLAARVDGNKVGFWEVASGRGYRTLVRSSAHGKGNYDDISIHKDGRLLAVGMTDGFGLWDLTSSHELAIIKSTKYAHVLFEPSGALLTQSWTGLLRWPVRANPLSPELLECGMPYRLPLPGSIYHIACSRDGRVVASAQGAGALVLNADHPQELVPLTPHADVRHIAVSPDGEWIATGSHNGVNVKIWEARDGKFEFVRELAVATPSRVGFSPDGKWLATGGGGCRLWAVGSWQEGPQIGGGVFDFSSDGKLLAVETGHGVVRLVHPDTAREYARLEDPNQDHARWIRFSPDGTQLVTTTECGAGSIHVWDLREIRQRLAEMDLDWDLPLYPPKVEMEDARPLRVNVESATRLIIPPGPPLRLITPGDRGPERVPADKR